MMRGLSPFAWRGQPSSFVADRRFNTSGSGAKGVAPQALPGMRFVRDSINTDAVKPADKTSKILRGAM